MPRKSHHRGRRSIQVQPIDMRVVGGTLGGRKILYDGDPATRPMKDRTREAVFNLVGPTARDKLVLDFFSGTGAMAIEALSRGASRAIAVERRFPAAKTIQENARQLDIENRLEVVSTDTFRWWKSWQKDVSSPWLAFVCPPYSFFADRTDEMLALTIGLIDDAPSGSLIVLEFDQQFDASMLPQSDSWDIRTYRPATIALYEKP